MGHPANDPDITWEYSLDTAKDPVYRAALAEVARGAMLKETPRVEEQGSTVIAWFKHHEFPEEGSNQVWFKAILTTGTLRSFIPKAEAYIERRKGQPSS